MNPAINGRFHIAIWESKILIKVEGFAAQNNSLFFCEFVEKMLQEGFKDFIIDLSCCKSMDSTFMGVLVSVIRPEPKGNGNEDSTSVTIINSNAYHQKLLDSLGISQVLKIKKTAVTLPDIPMKTIEEKRYDSQARLKIIKEAHQALLAFPSDYQQVFANFVHLLDEELQQEERQERQSTVPKLPSP